MWVLMLCAAADVHPDARVVSINRWSWARNLSRGANKVPGIAYGEVIRYVQEGSMSWLSKIRIHFAASSYFIKKNDCHIHQVLVTINSCSNGLDSLADTPIRLIKLLAVRLL